MKYISNISSTNKNIYKIIALIMPLINLKCFFLKKEIIFACVNRHSLLRMYANIKIKIMTYFL